MFNFFNKKSNSSELSTATFQLSGLHCSSCSLTIDNALEDLEGVNGASTSYAKSEVVVKFNPNKIGIQQLKSAIQAAGYQVLSPTRS